MELPIRVFIIRKIYQRRPLLVMVAAIAAGVMEIYRYAVLQVVHKPGVLLY